MIVRPNANEPPANSHSTDAINGHDMKMQGSFTEPTPMNAANVQRGGGAAGFGYSLDPTGEVNTPRVDSGLNQLKGLSGD